MERPLIFDTSDGQQLRINMISPWLKNNYRELGLDAPAKIVKLSLDGGFTCPNRDGTKGTGGCLFCSESGSGDMASSITARAVGSALDRQIKLLSDKEDEAEALGIAQHLRINLQAQSAGQDANEKDVGGAEAHAAEAELAQRKAEGADKTDDNNCLNGRGGEECFA